MCVYIRVCVYVCVFMYRNISVDFFVYSCIVDFFLFLFFFFLTVEGTFTKYFLLPQKRLAILILHCKSMCPALQRLSQCRHVSERKGLVEWPFLVGLNRLSLSFFSSSLCVGGDGGRASDGDVYCTRLAAAVLCKVQARVG